MNIQSAISKLEQCENYFEAKEKDYNLKNIVTFLLGFQPIYEIIKKTKDEKLIHRADALLYSHLNLLASNYGMKDQSTEFFENANYHLYLAGKIKNPLNGRFVHESLEMEEQVN